MNWLEPFFLWLLLLWHTTNRIGQQQKQSETGKNAKFNIKICKIHAHFLNTLACIFIGKQLAHVCILPTKMVKLFSFAMSPHPIRIYNWIDFGNGTWNANTHFDWMLMLVAWPWTFSHSKCVFFALSVQIREMLFEFMKPRISQVSTHSLQMNVPTFLISCANVSHNTIKPDTLTLSLHVSLRDSSCSTSRRDPSRWSDRKFSSVFLLSPFMLLLMLNIVKSLYVTIKY